LQRIREIPQAATLFQQMQAEADEALKEKIALPPLRHGYAGSYVCKEHSSTLQYRGPGRHWCPKGEHFVEGNDAVERAGDYRLHAKLSDQALLLARVAWLTGEPRYARKSAEILLAYAEKFPGFDFHHDESTGYHARVAHAVLGECWWFAPIPRALDLIRGAGVLSPAEDRRIVERLILPTVLGIHSHRIVANQQAEINRAVGMGALVARQWPLAAEAVDGEAGIRAQWRADFDLDGISIERELPYHFAALTPFTDMATAYETIGVPIFDARFKRLFDAPIAYSPDQRVGSYAAVYEPALAMWGDPVFARQVAGLRAKKWHWSSLISPVENVDTALVGTGNSVLPAGGYTTLRGETPGGQLVTALVNYGSPSHRGGRVLLDPQITWQGAGLNQRVLRIGYGYEGSGFSYTPAAGNGLLVDGKGGSMLRADQEALLDGPHPAGRWTTPLHRPQFPGVTWSRAVALCGDTALILDQIASREPRRFDLLTYLPGDIANSDTADWQTAAGFAEEGDGYAYLRHPRKAPGEGAADAFDYRLHGTKSPELSGRVRFIGSAAETYLAEANAEWHPRKVPVVIRRTGGTASWSATAFTGGNASVQIRRLEATRDGTPLPAEEALAVELVADEGRYLVLTARKPGIYEVAGERVEGPLTVRFSKR